jgi:hypothetical protein
MLFIPLDDEGDDYPLSMPAEASMLKLLRQETTTTTTYQTERSLFSTMTMTMTMM